MASPGAPTTALNWSTVLTLDAIGHREAFGLNWDPSHMMWQELDPVGFLVDFADRIYHVDCKDTKMSVGNGRNGRMGSHLPWADPRRGWTFVSTGNGDVPWQRCFRTLNAIGYTGPISIDNSTGYIGGGGGGGGAQNGAPVAIIIKEPAYGPGGGGAGGGRGGPMLHGDTNGTVLGSFGAGGAIGQIGAVATDANSWAGQTIAPHGGAGGASGAGAIAGGGL